MFCKSASAIAQDRMSPLTYFFSTFCWHRITCPQAVYTHLLQYLRHREAERAFSAASIFKHAFVYSIV